MGLDIKYIAGQTPIDEDERQGLKIKTITTVRELNEFEQLNIEEAVKWSMGVKKSVEDLANEEFIKDVHRRMYGKVWQWAGQFRNTNKNIGVDKFRIGIDLRQLCDDFKYWHQHDIYTPVERIIRFKHRLVAIHCFPNGNGRHSRLMADILADKLYGFPVFSWGGCADLSSESDIRRTYLSALREADHGSYTSLINFATSK